MKATIHIYTVEIITPDMFGEMHRYENTYEVHDVPELEYNIFNWYGEIDYTILNHDVEVREFEFDNI